MPESLKFGENAPSEDEQPLHPSHPALPAPATLNAVHAAPAVSTALHVGLKSAPLLPGNPSEGAKIPAARVSSPHGKSGQPLWSQRGLALALEFSNSISVVGNRLARSKGQLRGVIDVIKFVTPLSSHLFLYFFFLPPVF